MSLPSLPSLTASTVQRLQASFRLGKSKSYEWRIKQIKTLKSMIISHENEFLEALAKDLGRCTFEGYVTYYIILLIFIRHTFLYNIPRSMFI